MRLARARGKWGKKSLTRARIASVSIDGVCAFCAGAVVRETHVFVDAVVGGSSATRQE